MLRASYRAAIAVWVAWRESRAVGVAWRDGRAQAGLGFPRAAGRGGGADRGGGAGRSALNIRRGLGEPERASDSLCCLDSCQEGFQNGQAVAPLLPKQRRGEPFGAGAEPRL